MKYKWFLSALSIQGDSDLFFKGRKGFFHQNYGHVKALENLFRDFDGIRFIPKVPELKRIEKKMLSDSKI